jgi:ketosteroid isomerase-like protein
MSENVQVVREMYEAFHAGDGEGSLRHFAPDVTVDTSRRPDGTLGQGHEHLAATIGAWIGAFDDWSEEIEEIREVDGRVHVVAVQRGRGKGSGVAVEQRYGVVYEIEEALIVRMTLYSNLAEEFEQEA